MGAGPAAQQARGGSMQPPGGNYYARPHNQPYYGYFSQSQVSQAGGTQMSLNNLTQPLSQSTDRTSLTGFSQVRTWLIVVDFCRTAITMITRRCLNHLPRAIIK